ncbi:uncharacterized protein LOC141848320 [Curcuma longa]|uniref:uncharacterized protein LOC141848320 n=1 Tax=Curcuma longa TaxID=136217 RepID=UPI003D9FA0A5
MRGCKVFSTALVRCARSVPSLLPASLLKESVRDPYPKGIGYRGLKELGWCNDPSSDLAGRWAREFCAYWGLTSADSEDIRSISEVGLCDQAMRSSASFTPEGHKVAAYISSKFRERVCRSGHTWRHVDQDMRSFYYDEFLKKYTFEPGHEREFQDAWNAAAGKLYKDLLYKCRTKGTRPSWIPEDIWAAWQAVWQAERWQANAEIARSNRKTEIAGPSTGSTKHTAGSRSIVEHTLDLEHQLQRPPTCWEIFTKTHKSKDDTFIDARSQALDAEYSARVAQASAPAVEGGERQELSTDQLNEIYYDVVGGRKKSSTLYGLGSQARVVYDRVMAPRPRGRPSGSDSAIEALQKENQELKDRLAGQQDRLAALEAQAESQARLGRQMAAWMEAFGQTPSQPAFDALRAAMRGADPDTETQDPNAPDQ